MTTTPMSAKEVGLRIRHLRNQQGWSLTELATRAGISRSYLHQIEQGDSTPTLDKVQQLATTLGVSASELLGEREASESKSNYPESLQAFAEQANLQPADIDMLAKIQYRGKRPNSIQEWRAIYSVIKGLLENGS